jgi:predicted nucleic acid-binding protein
MLDAVSDSSPLIHLAKIEALELISRLYRRILIPPATAWCTVTGTLGVPLRAKQVGLIVALQPSVTRLQSEGGYYIDPGLIEKVLLVARE